jgi:hypothetical protein
MNKKKGLYNLNPHLTNVRTNLPTPSYPILPLIWEGKIKNSGKRTIHVFKSPYEEDLEGSILPDKMEKSELKKCFT